MENIETRKRLFELLERYYELSKPSVFSRLTSIIVKPKPKNETLEIIEEIIQILGNENLYIDLPQEYFQIKEGLELAQADGEYDGLSISIKKEVIDSIAVGNKNFFALVEIIGHEQRHHVQDLVIQGKKQNYDIATKVLQDFQKGYMSEEELDGLYRILYEQQHTILKPFTRKTVFTSDDKLTDTASNLLFGEYLDSEHERDARDYAKKFTIEMLEKLTSDSLCPQKLKNRLLTDGQFYQDEIKLNEKEFKKSMSKFASFQRRLKKSINKVLVDENIDKFEVFQLLSSCLDVITEVMSPKELMQYYSWAVENNYANLLKNINIQNTKSQDKELFRDYLTKLITSKNITSKSAEAVFVDFIHLSDKTEKDREINTSLICSQITNGQLMFVCNELNAVLDPEYLDINKIAEKFISYMQDFLSDTPSAMVQGQGFNTSAIYYLFNIFQSSWATTCLKEDLNKQITTLSESFHNNELPTINTDLNLFLEIYGKKCFIEHYGESKYEKLCEEAEELEM